MRLDLHDMVCVAGLLCLAALAWLLWHDEPETVPVREAFLGPEPVTPEPAPRLPRVRTYDRGRTLIAPLVSQAYLDKKRAQ